MGRKSPNVKMQKYPRKRQKRALELGARRRDAEGLFGRRRFRFEEAKRERRREGSRRRRRRGKIGMD